MEQIMVAAFKEELAKVAETRLAWFVAGAAVASNSLPDLFHTLTKFAGF
jgi:hypothetical protein